MKQELAESSDFKVSLHVSIYFLKNPPLATILFRMRRLNSPTTRCRISAIIDSCFHDSYNPKDESPKAHISKVAPAHSSKMAMDWLKDRFSEKLI